MKKIFILFIASLIAAGAPVQIAASPASAELAHQPVKKSNEAKKTANKKKSASASKSSTAKNRNSADVKKDRQDNSKKLRLTKEQIEANRKKTSNRLNQLNSLTAEVDTKTREVDALQSRIDSTTHAIAQVSDSIERITYDVARLRKSSAQTLREARTRRQAMSPLAMVFASENFNQAFKRLGYLKQLDKSRTSKAHSLKSSLAVLDEKKVRLEALKSAQDESMVVLSQQQDALVKRQHDMSAVVAQLRKEGGALEKELTYRQEKSRQLDRELDRIITYEEQQAAEKERKRQQEAEAREKKRAEQEAKAAAEAAAKAEKERLKQQEAAQKAEQQAQAKAKKEADEKAQIQERIKAEAAKQAENAAKKKAELEAKKAKEAAKAKGKDKKSSKRGKKGAVEEPVVPPKPAVQETPKPEPAPAPNFGDFASAKGNLLFPVQGKHSIVGRFGRSKHANLSHVEIDNSGIDIEVPQGTHARASFGGVVSSIFHLDGYHNIVMLRHGEYLTVYANISSLLVKKGETVKPGQSIGAIYSDPDDNDRTILHFEVRHEREKLNPLEWLK